MSDAAGTSAHSILSAPYQLDSASTTWYISINANTIQEYDFYVQSSRYSGTFISAVSGQITANVIDNCLYDNITLNSTDQGVTGLTFQNSSEGFP